MEIQNSQPFFDLIQKSQTVLIALPKQPRKDAIGSALAIAGFLSKLDKEVMVACDDAPLQAIEFIPGSDRIQKGLSASNAFVISVNTEQVKLEELSYHEVAQTDAIKEHVEIHLQPANGGMFSERDVTFSQQQARFDMVIIVDTPSLEFLGALYTDNAALFLDSPKVNIDNHIANQNYGTLNIVEVTAAATSEIVFELLKKFEATLIDASIATALLTGIISETNSFQKPATTHNSFIRASELIAYGADQQEIVRNLFKTRSFAMLKLWGRAMARMKTLPDFTKTTIYFSVVTAQDIERSAANEQDEHQSFHELIANIPDLKAMFYVLETKPQLTLFIYMHPNLKIDDVAHELHANIISETVAEAKLDMPVAEAERYITDTLLRLKNRIGL